MRYVLVVTLLGLGLSACGNPYALSVDQVNLEAKQEPAQIQFTGFKLHKREALINERKEEVAYLRGLLTKTTEADFPIEPEIIRELEVIQSFSAAAGLKFDPAAAANFTRSTEIADVKQDIAVTRLQMQLDQLKRDAELLRDKLEAQTEPSQSGGEPESDGPDAVNASVAGPTAADLQALITAVNGLNSSLAARLDTTVPRAQKAAVAAGPIDKLNDIEAYRDTLKAAINRASLDELHDRNGNSLFRLQIDATVLPGTKDSRNTLGVLRLEVAPPPLDEEQIQRLYFMWLAQVNRNLNLPPKPSKFAKDERIRPSASLTALGPASGLYSIAAMICPL